MRALEDFISEIKSHVHMDCDLCNSNIALSMEEIHAEVCLKRPGVACPGRLLKLCDFSSTLQNYWNHECRMALPKFNIGKGPFRQRTNLPDSNFAGFSSVFMAPNQPLIWRPMLAAGPLRKIGLNLFIHRLVS